MTKKNPLFLLALLAIPSIAFAARWVPVSGGRDGARLEVDVSSRQSVGEGRVRLWHRESYATPRRPESEAFSFTRLTVLSEFLCDKRQVATLQQSHFAKDGTEIRTETFESKETRPVIPDSNIESVFAYACRAAEKPKIVTPPPPEPVTAPPPAESSTKKKDGKKGQEEPVHVPHWSYSGATGPEKWGSMAKEFALCDQGQRQSPIDIRKTVKADLPAIQFDYKNIPLSIVDNGHSVKVDTPNAGTISVDGETYTLLQFHFHKPSEEKINGKAYDLVAHLVHQSKDGKLAVVAVLFEIGKKEHPLIRLLWSNLPLEQEKAYAPKDVSFNPLELLPSKRSYYTFLGSLTTPPCSEGVRWLVLKTPVTVSKEQISGFGTVYKNNVRPVQPVNDRVIKEGR